MSKRIIIAILASLMGVVTFIGAIFMVLALTGNVSFLKNSITITTDSYEKEYDGREVSLTPILVDKVNDDPKSRKFCFGQREEDAATDAEMALVTDAEEVMATAPDSESFEGCGLEKDSEDMEEELTDEAVETEEDRAFRDFIDFLQAMIDP